MPAFGQTLFGDPNTAAASCRYIAHPDSSSPNWDDGEPVDTGFAMITSSNQSWLAYEGVRHLVSDIGTGTLSYHDRGFDGLDGAPAPPGSMSFTNQGSISWDRRTARKYGPFAGVLDRQRLDVTGNPIGYTFRDIAFECDVSSGASNSLTMFYAVTPPEILPSSSTYMFNTAVIASGRHTSRVVLTASAIPPTSAAVLWQCRPDGNDANTQVAVIPYMIWVGWYSTNASDAIISVNVWETR